MNRRLKILVSVCIMLSISPVAAIACPPDCGDCEYFDEETQQCEYQCYGCCSCFNDSCENVDYYCDACEYCTSCGCECAVFANLISGISGTYAIGDSTTVSASTSGSLPPGCSIDWSGDASFEDISGTSATAVFNTAGTGLQITAATSCQARPVPSAQFDVIDVAITTPSSYPVYIEFGGSVQLDCTPEGPTDGSYSWSPGTVTFSPSANIKNPTFSANQSGNYTASVSYSLGGATVGDTSGTIKVVSVTSVVATADYASVGQNVTFGALTDPLNSAPYVTVAWSGTDGKSGSGSQFTTNWSTPGPKTVTATIGTSTAQKQVTVVAVDKVVKQGTTDEGPLFVCIGGSVNLEAKPNPPGASFPTGEAHWTIESQPSGASASLNPTSGSATTTLSGLTIPGNYVVKAACGTTSDTITITVVKVDKVVKQGTTDEGPLYPGCPGTAVSLEAKPNPPGASFLAGEPHWEIVSKPEGASASLNPTSGSATTTLSGLNKWGDYVVRAKCGDSDTGDTITIRFNLINETGYSYFSPDWGSIPDECPPSGDGDGEDSYELDDCDNELEVSCCRSDGSGGDTGNAYRYFYNSGLVSSCPWLYSPENSFNRKTATIEGTSLTYVTKMKHSSIGGYNWFHRWTEGCIGYYCSMFVFYDCITGSSPVYWRRSWEYPPQDYYEGEYCPGHYEE